MIAVLFVPGLHKVMAALGKQRTYIRDIYKYIYIYIYHHMLLLFNLAILSIKSINVATNE